MEEIIFPNQIRTYRKQHGCTMQMLADELGMSLSAISKIEKGYRRLDQEQLTHVASFLNCNLQDLFVNEINTKPEVVLAWKKEQERRCKTNISGGLKTMGAGLRQIRTEKDLTLIEVAAKSGLTLSVYHRIEMGQREVSDKELKGIAKALSITTDKLQEKIKILESKGILAEIIQKNDAKYRALATPKGANGIDSSKIIVYKTKPLGNGSFSIDLENSNEVINRPVYLQGKVSTYAIRPQNMSRFDAILPENTTLFIDSANSLANGDLAVYYTSETEIKLVKIVQNGENIFGMLFNPTEKISINDDKKIHKIVFITL